MDTPTLEPTITVGAIGIITSVIGSVLGGIWFTVRAATNVQKVFSAIEKQLALLAEDHARNIKRLEIIEVDIKKLTEIMSHQERLLERVSNAEHRVDDLNSRFDRFIDEIGRRFIGNDVSRIIGGPR